MIEAAVHIVVYLAAAILAARVMIPRLYKLIAAEKAEANPPRLDYRRINRMEHELGLGHSNYGDQGLSVDHVYQETSSETQVLINSLERRLNPPRPAQYCKVCGVCTGDRDYCSRCHHHHSIAPSRVPVQVVHLHPLDQPYPMEILPASEARMAHGEPPALERRICTIIKPGRHLHLEGSELKKTITRYGGNPRDTRTWNATYDREADMTAISFEVWDDHHQPSKPKPWTL